MIDIVNDVEADGPCPSLYSMVSLGAAAVKNGEIVIYYSGVIKPISDRYIPEALAVSGVSREEQLLGRDPAEVMIEYANWVQGLEPGGRYTFWSDNPAFDWQFINYYFHGYTSGNPYGFSARRIGDLYAGAVKDITKATKWKYMRDTKHTHNPADDAKGNLEALIKIKRMLK